ALEELMERQKVISERAVDQDVVAMVAEDESACVQMFYVRGGRLIGQRHFILDGVNGESPAAAIQEFIKQFYQTAASIPSEVLLPVEIEESQIIENWLRGRRGSKVELLIPKRGERRRLVEMAAENAKLAIEQIMIDQRGKEARNQRSLLQLAEAIGLSDPPRRIECFDISNFQGTAPVASMVVCEGGEMVKSEYRRFKIKWHEETPDDFAMMREVITRRLNESLHTNPKFARMPDLIIVDGGKGQLSSALAAMEELKIHLPVAGLAKQFEYLFIPDRSDPVILPRGSAGLHLVQRIRDEAHRFALTYHRKIRLGRQSFSKLDEVPGIGAVRRKALIRRFGSLDGLRAAILDELAGTEKMSRPVAEKLYRYLHPEDDEKKERAS
ncbi:MAG: excinuclease ABC subunit UvrC, partial [Armatimonadetes bacterium]|nr:excinuclease ABC subunit UvrC [Armatimonadota bacterium]